MKNRFPVSVLVIGSLAALIVILVLFMISQDRQYREEEEAVYAALLSEMQGTVLLADQTSEGGFMFNHPDSGWINVQRNLPAVSRETWNDYLARNEKSHRLSSDMQLGIRYRLMGEEEMRDIFNRESSGVMNPSDGGWEELYRRYPDADGITKLSRAGFNPTYTQALVDINISKWSLVAEFYLVCLEKRNGVWQIVERWLRAMA